MGQTELRCHGGGQTANEVKRNKLTVEAVTAGTLKMTLIISLR
jgi:hypothetical protein